MNVGSFEFVARLIDAFTKPFKEMINGMTKGQVEVTGLTKSVDKMNNSFTATYGTWLNIMFLSMQLNRVFGGLRDLLFQIYLNSIFMEFTFGMLAAIGPIIDPLLDILYGLLDIFYGLPEGMQLAIGGFFLLMGAILSLIPLIAGIALLLGPMGLGPAIAAAGGLIPYLVGGLSTLASGFIAILPPVLAIIAIIVALWLAWQYNFGNIQEHVAKLFEFLAGIFGGIIKIFQGLWDIIMGIIEVNPDKIVAGLTKMGSGIWDIFSNLFINIPIELAKFFFDILVAVGKWAGEWLLKVGKLLADIIQAILDWDIVKKFAKIFADIILAIVKWGIDMGSKAVTAGAELINGLVKGIKSVAYKIGEAIWNAIPKEVRDFIKGTGELVGGIASGIGNVASAINPFDDFLFRPGQAPVRFSPQDTIVGMKDISSLGRGNNNYGGNEASFVSNITINVGSASRSDLDTLKRELNQSMESDFKRLTSGWR
uniref:Putative tail tape measure protein n=1 Tax=viral metagenome TaxID=1070528 RepID=A0A6H1ZMR3_9ZZZZ